MSKLYYGFLDESGILEKKTDTGNYFVITVIIVGYPNELKQVIKIAHRKAKNKFKFHSVFKASKEDKGFVKLVLQEIVKRDVKIVIGIFDKKNKKIKMDKNVLYFKLVAATVNLCLQDYQKLNLVIHKRYTLPSIRQQLEQKVSQLTDDGKFLAISQQTEKECKELELADVVAWAIFQKYNNRCAEFYNIIQQKIQKENRLAA